MNGPHHGDGALLIAPKPPARNNASDVLCAHIRQTDFQTLKWNRPIEECLAVIKHIARMKAKRTVVIFGDDQKFMANMLKKLIDDRVVLPNSFYSDYTQPDDLYLSNRLCKTFVATAELKPKPKPYS